MTADPLAGDFYRFADDLTDDERGTLARVREFLEKEVAPVALDHWSRAEFPHELIPGFAALDIARLPYAALGPKPRQLLIGFISMEMAHTDPSMNSFFGIHNGLAMGSIDLCGSDEQRERWLPPMARMELIGAFALTEPHGGSDVARGLQTTARRDGDSWVLDGAKRWIGNATFADLVVVWARDVDTNQVLGFVVEKGTPGFSATKIERKIALRIVQNADIVLEDCRVPEANRLQNANSFKDTAKILRQTRSGVAWEAVGMMLAA